MKNIVITGATEGVGKATALALAALPDIHLILHGRNEIKLKAVRAAIGEKHPRTEVDFLVADFSSLAQVRQMAQQVRSRYSHLDVLINNAGSMFAERGETADGFERNFGINYLAPTLLTDLLLDTLTATPGARIVNLSSVGYKSAKPDFENLQANGNYGMMPAYFNSKLFNLYYTLTLAERLGGGGVTVNAVHPGGVRTQLARDFKGPIKFLFSIMMPLFFISPEKGAETSVYVATSPDVQGMTGKYFTKRKPETLTSIGTNMENRRKLNELTAKLLQPWF